MHLIALLYSQSLPKEYSQEKKGVLEVAKLSWAIAHWLGPL